MASPIVIPELLKQVKPYLTLAAQLEGKNERVVGYYCKLLHKNLYYQVWNVTHLGRLYALQHGMTINKTATECKKFLLQQMDMLENVSP